MKTYLVSIDRGPAYELLAADSMDAWMAARSQHPKAGSIRVTLKG